MASPSPSRLAPLQPSDWIRIGFSQLAREGIESVRIEVLARELGVSKGSFYWHFKDRNALLEALLEHWVERQTLAVIRRVNSKEHSAETKLWRILELASLSPRAVHGADVELAIRAWARRSPLARTAIDDVDTQRLSYLTQLFIELGFPRTEAKLRSSLAHYYVLSAGLVKPESEAFLQRLTEFARELLTSKPSVGRQRGARPR